MQALLLVDHGSRRSEANEQLACVSRLIAYQLGGQVPVAYAHMELATPTVTDAFAELVERGATEVVVFPYLLAPGRHAEQDIPRLVAQAAAPHSAVRFRVAAPFGVHPLLGEVVMQHTGLSAVRRAEAPVKPCERRAEACGEPWCRE